MTNAVKVKVRPGHSLQFPAICVHCSGPGSERLTVRGRQERLTRLIDVPLCAECFRELRRQSHQEERLQKLGWLSAGITTLLGLALLLILLPGAIPFWVRFLAALAGGALMAVGVYGYFHRRRLAAARPEKQAVLQAVTIAEFSWRTTTFVFENERFAAQFAELNRPLLMES